jgi:hypothetical protein
MAPPAYFAGAATRTLSAGHEKAAQDKALRLVPGGGIEPPRAEARRILSPLRLPVPPSRRAWKWLEKVYQFTVLMLLDGVIVTESGPSSGTAGPEYDVVLFL